MNTGQTSWHAPHVVHAQSVSSCTRPPVSFGSASASPFVFASCSRVDEIGMRMSVVETVR
jgi:hypothetical protein